MFYMLIAFVNLVSVNVLITWPTTSCCIVQEYAANSSSSFMDDVDAT